MKVKIVVTIVLTMSIRYKINKILQLVVTIKFLFQMTYITKIQLVAIGRSCATIVVDNMDFRWKEKINKILFHLLINCIHILIYDYHALVNINNKCIITW